MVEDSRKRRRKKRRTKFILKTTLIAAIVALLALGSGVWYIFNHLSDTAAGSYQGLDRGNKSERRIEPVDVGKDNFSMLLLGSDYREGDGAERTDSVMVATFNKSERSIILTSIPRDTYVEIVGYRGGGFKDKITHAHAFGGIDMAIATVEELLDIPIDHYALIRFDGLVDVVDALGGIDLELTYDIDFEEKSRGVDFQFRKGPAHLNGEQALAYARERKSASGGGDKGRGIRQQQVVEAIIDKAASFSSITRFDDVFQAVGDNLQMDLTFPNIISLHGYASSLSGIETMQLETTGTRRPDIYGNSIWYEDIHEDSLLEIQQTLKQHLELTDAGSANFIDPTSLESEALTDTNSPSGTITPTE
ncbi:LCP family glycopolymer transferase [Shouchella clausii]|uniref:LCP family glycopolymer transferase n=1 Tax=Shouchella clausii TaxID=79880 RepID=UPI000BA708CE|nr:LCP family protein [Shouchella clausii]PAD90156.1 hypothetical protein CHH52_21330 [Shouchella clausii]